MSTVNGRGKKMGKQKKKHGYTEKGCLSVEWKDGLDEGKWRRWKDVLRRP